MKKFLRSTCCLTLSAAIFAASLPVSFLRSQPAYAIAPGENVQCDVQSEQVFRENLEKIIASVLKEVVGVVDYEEIVGRSWASHKINDKIDELVDIEYERIKDSKTTGELLKTITSKQAREQIAKDLAEGVYGSEKFKVLIEKVAEDVALALSSRMDGLSSKTMDPVSTCVRRFLGPQYGGTIANFISNETRHEMAVDPAGSKSDVGVTQVLKETTGGLAGVIMVALRKSLVQRLSRTLGKRILGAVVTRAVGAVVSVVGWLLIAKDIWDFRNGFLPMIAKEMKSDEAKKRVREELVKELNTEVETILAGVPADVAGGIFKVWEDFKVRNEATVKLAKNNDAFRNFLETLRGPNETINLERLRKTNQLVALISQYKGEEAVLAAMRDGSLKNAIMSLPEIGVQIAMETKSIDIAFDWHKLAGSDLQDIYTYSLHKTHKASDFNRDELVYLLFLKDRDMVQKVAGLSKKERSALFNLPKEDFRVFADKLTSDDLAGLAFYLDQLPSDSSRLFLRAIRNEPYKMKLLAHSNVQQGILNSRDRDAALLLMTRSSSSFEFMNFPADLKQVLDGNISARLLWSKQPFTLMVAAFLLLIFLLMLKRLFFGGGRRKVSA